MVLMRMGTNGKDMTFILVGIVALLVVVLMFLKIFLMARQQMYFMVIIAHLL